MCFDIVAAFLSSIPLILSILFPSRIKQSSPFNIIPFLLINFLFHHPYLVPRFLSPFIRRFYGAFFVSMFCTFALNMVEA